MSTYCQIFEANIDESVCRIGREEHLASCKGCSRTATRDYIAEKTSVSIAASAVADKHFRAAKRIAVLARLQLITKVILIDAARQIKRVARG